MSSMFNIWNCALRSIGGHDAGHLSGHDSHHEQVFSAQEVKPFFLAIRTTRVKYVHNGGSAAQRLRLLLYMPLDMVIPEENDDCSQTEYGHLSWRCSKLGGNGHKTRKQLVCVKKKNISKDILSFGVSKELALAFSATLLCFFFFLRAVHLFLIEFQRLLFHQDVFVKKNSWWH